MHFLHCNMGIRKEHFMATHVYLLNILKLLCIKLHPRNEGGRVQNNLQNMSALVASFVFLSVLVHMGSVAFMLHKMCSTLAIVMQYTIKRELDASTNNAVCTNL